MGRQTAAPRESAAADLAASASRATAARGTATPRGTTSAYLAAASRRTARADLAAGPVRPPQPVAPPARTEPQPALEQPMTNPRTVQIAKRNCRIVTTWSHTGGETFAVQSLGIGDNFAWVKRSDYAPGWLRYSPRGAITSRGLMPFDGPTRPSRSICSTMRAARL